MSWLARSWLPPAGLVSRFGDGLLAADLPRLPPERRAAAIGFVGRRVAGLPSPMLLGVSAVATAIGALAGLVGTARVVAVARRWPLPVVADYVRLVRSLGYAYVWEHWPDTGPDGAPGR